MLDANAIAARLPAKKTTELIEQLQALLREYGDLDVRLYARSIRGELEIDRAEHNEDDASPAITICADD